MIKAISLLSLSLLTVVSAVNVESEVGVNVGLNSTKNEDGFKFENPRIGFTYQNNRYIVTPRVDLDYVKVKDDYASSLLKASVNGVYEYENKTYTIPYALAGLGYEYVSGSTTDVFESHPFMQGGLGLRIDLDDGYKIRLEGKMLRIIGGNNEGDEGILTLGMSMPLGISKPKLRKPRVIKRQPIQARPVIQQVQPIIIEEVVPAPIVEAKPQVLYVNNNECSIKIDAPDLDRDGVEDRLDQCPATPCNFTVDHYGCPIKTTLKINFATNSAEIYQDSMYRIDNFAKFLLDNRGSMVKIEGHTDNRGSASYNVALSKRRANAVMQALISRGVSPGRLSAEGYGENIPLSTNMTEEGRAMNRRIEAILSYPKGGR